MASNDTTINAYHTSPKSPEYILTTRINRGILLTKAQFIVSSHRTKGPLDTTVHTSYLATLLTNMN
jgi:hypothetical protein